METIDANRTIEIERSFEKNGTIDPIDPIDPTDPILAIGASAKVIFRKTPAIRRLIADTP